MMLPLFLRFISATLVVALPFDDTRWRYHHHHGRSLYRKKRRAFADEENLFFFDGSHHAVITNNNNNKRNVQVVQMSPNVGASSSKAPPESGKSIECDPRRADDAKPDVGILASCAKGSECVQSNESALGGVCRLSAQQRLLDQGFGGYAEYFCDDNSGQQGVQSPFESCDCSQLVNGVGPFNCTVYSRYCFDVDEKYCSSVTLEGEVRPESPC
jgi:hypothetical protein